ncbi:MAG TPA: serine/threonine-protein kinase [Steroidobacteraceae bacterium]|nr:serine/threonine-protein kinase [Steroidobacteraceae bacterium]HNS28422.1 serine/threonine-protein kinase [Steroidobacteraceae bacterium]
MDEPLSRQAEPIFLAASELPPAERAAHLDRACAGNAGLRREVEALLDAAERSSDYFEKLPGRLGVASFMSGDAATDPEAPLAGEAGQQFGQYRLTAPVGRGGMGAVWRAVRADGRYETDVAVKLLSRTAGGAPERFALEARYLAKLAHPNIARLLDAGVGPNGQPYLVLELVDGQPIDRYCEQHALGVRERITLFLAVLDAVAHAHAHLIVHRDIKPSNVQVAADGTVKLLDFGVAKLLGGEAAAPGLTRELGTALTPEFAAPEQLSGDAITTATDIYALGLLLWLILTGRNPREAAGACTLAELRAQAAREPAPLADAVPDASPELRRALQSDLDNIVRKALAVEPAERYATAADFRQDLQRYLRDEPVMAQAQTIGYRARKFVRRHRGGVLAAALTTIALVGTTAIATWMGIEARRQRDVAIYQQQRVQATNEFLNLLMNEIGPGGKPLTMTELLERGVEMLDRQYGAGGEFLGRMYFELANAHFSLGDTARLAELLGRAEEQARAQDDADLLAAVLCTAARARMRAEPEAAAARIAAARQALARADVVSVDSRVSCDRAEAQALELEGDRPAAIAELRATLDALAANPAASVQHRLYVMNELSRLTFNERRLVETLALNEETLDLMTRSGRGGSLGYVVNAFNGSMVLHSLGEIRRAHDLQLGLLERVEALERDGVQIGFGGYYAASLLRLARCEEALPIIEQERDMLRESGNLFGAAAQELTLGRLMVCLGRFAAAAAHLDAVEPVLEKAPGSNERLLALLAVTRAQVALGRGEPDRAKALVDAELARVGYPEDRSGPDLLHLLRIAGEIALVRGDAAAAETYAADGHAAALRVARDPAQSADVGQALLLRATARKAQGNAAGARSDLEEAVTSLANGLGEEHPDTKRARALLPAA